MNDSQKATAQTCLTAAETDAMAFPQIVGALNEAGFESYTVDLRRSTATYFLPDGDRVELAAHKITTAIADHFDAAKMQAAIREAQQQVAGYTYKGFCEKAAAAGCASYIVSFLGRRALYIGRSGETHTEHFPD
ncbi:DUF1398 domain-containing protein [Cypionkella sp.]|uniref:DUF1398 domain-containing protein n=1 Tax=Cypionkella sp. TaxID=2811411 RepID=UPI002AB9CEF5|nr:DUF1398 family protein [Cypionkella sp.]MDZ4395593.1 DUF1398 family protein [Cypionkella sp.]